MLMFLLYSASFPYTEVAAKLMEEKYNVPENIAVQLFGIPSFIAAATCPFVGILGDKLNARVYAGIKHTLFYLP